MNTKIIPLYLMAIALVVIAMVQVVSIDPSDVRSKLGLVEPGRLALMKPLSIYTSDKNGSIASIEPLCEYRSDVEFVTIRGPVDHIFKNRFGYAMPIMNTIALRSVIEESLFPATSITDKISVLFADSEAVVALPPQCERSAIQAVQAGRVVCVVDTVVTSATSGKVLGVDFKDLAFFSAVGTDAPPPTCPIRHTRTWRVATNLISAE